MNAEIVFRFNLPVRKESVFGQCSVFKRCADRHLRHRDDDFPQALIEQLVQPQKHQCTGFAAGGRRFDKQIGAVALSEGAGLHLPHPHAIKRRALPVLGIGHLQDVFHA